MQCHKCPHIESLNRGDYVSKPWSETPCAKCKLGEDTFYSILFDEEQHSAPAGITSSMSEYSHDVAHPERDVEIPVLPVATLAHFMQGVLTLDPELRDIVAWRYQGLTYKEIARRQGTSTQLAEMRHKRAIRDWPVLADLFPKKVAKQARRKLRQ